MSPLTEGPLSVFEVGFSVTENCQSFLPLFYHLHEAGGSPRARIPGRTRPGAPRRWKLCLSSQTGKLHLPIRPALAEGSCAPSPDWSPSAPSPPGPALLELPATTPACQLRLSGHLATVLSSLRPSWGFSLRDKQHVRHLTNRCHPRPCPAPPAGAEGSPPPWSQQHSPCSRQVLLPGRRPRASTPGASHSRGSEARLHRLHP